MSYSGSEPFVLMSERNGLGATSWMNRHPALLLLLFSLAFFPATLLHAETKPFWNDEIYTVIHIRMPSVGAMWSASAQGFDLMPPLNALLAHGVVSLFGEGRVTARLPAIGGYWLACLFIFLVVRRRAGAAMALMAMALFGLTATYRFAYETRGYGLLLGCSAVALYAWSEAAAGRRRTTMIAIMAGALAAGVWSHYFGVLIFAVIGMAELWRQWRGRKIDLRMWAGLTVGVLAFIPLLILVGLLHRHTTGYFGAAQHFTLASVYAFIFLPIPDWGPAASFGILAFATLVLVTIVEANGRRRPDGPPLLSHEAVAWIALAALPVIGLVVVHVVGSGLVPRYFLPTAFATAGLPILLGRLAIAPGRRLFLLTVIGVAWLAQVGQTFMPGRNTFRDPVTDDSALLQALQGPDPVVVANAVEYLQLWFYTPPELRDHLMYLADEDLSIRHLGSSTADASLTALTRWSDVNVVPFADFMTPGKTFEIYAADNGWLMDELRDRHVALEPGAADAHRRFFRATVPAR